MNRRNFLRNLIGTVAAVAVPSPLLNLTTQAQTAGIAPVMEVQNYNGYWISFAEAQLMEAWKRDVENSIWSGAPIKPKQNEE